MRRSRRHCGASIDGQLQERQGIAASGRIPVGPADLDSPVAFGGIIPPESCVIVMRVSACSLVAGSHEIELRYKISVMNTRLGCSDNKTSAARRHGEGIAVGTGGDRASLAGAAGDFGADSIGVRRSEE